MESDGKRWRNIRKTRRWAGRDGGKDGDEKMDSIRQAGREISKG